MAHLERFGVSMDADLLAAFDGLLEKRGYRNRSEALRDLIRNELIAEQWNPEHEWPTFGTLTIVYDHHKRELSDRLVALGHEHVGMHLATMHVHMDHDNCLEVTALKGPPKQLLAYSNEVLKLTGVKHGGFFPTGFAGHAH